MNMLNARLLSRYRSVAYLLERLDPQAKPEALSVPRSPQPAGDIMVFPGSFNPPTSAHVALLRQARQYARLHGGRWLLYAAFSKQIVYKEAV